MHHKSSKVDIMLWNMKPLWNFNFKVENEWKLYSFGWVNMRARDSKWNKKLKLKNVNQMQWKFSFAKFFPIVPCKNMAYLEMYSVIIVFPLNVSHISLLSTWILVIEKT